MSQTHMTRKWSIPVVGTRVRVPPWLWGPVALVGVALGGYGVFRANLSRYVWPWHWGTVEPGRIYRGALPEANLIRRTYRRYRIGAIVCLLGEEFDDPRQLEQDRVARQMGIELLRYPMRGNGIPATPVRAEAVQRYADAVAAVVHARRRGKVVLVQCSAGANRTGGVIACYRLLVEHWDGGRVYREMRKYGWHPSWNPELLPWLNGHMGEIAARLVAAGAIDKAPDPIPQIAPPQ